MNADLKAEVGAMDHATLVAEIRKATDQFIRDTGSGEGMYLALLCDRFFSSADLIAGALIELEHFIADELDPDPAPIEDYLTEGRRTAVMSLLGRTDTEETAR